MKKKTGPKSKPGLKWTVADASREFDVARELIERKRRAEAIEPDADGYFTTRQIVTLIFGDIAGETAREKLRLTRMQADGAALANEALRKERVPVEDVESIFSECYSNVAGLLKSHRDKLGDVLLQDLLAELRNMKLGND